MKFSSLSAKVGALALATVVFASCSEKTEVAKDQVSPEAIAKIQSMGFSTQNIQRDGDAYVVEGDIRLTDRDLAGAYSNGKLMRVGEAEQYRTTNLVSAPRAITLSLSSKMPASYGAVLDEVARRYNAQGLSLTFSRVASGGSIVLNTASGSYLASAGFPTADGQPYNSVKVNTRAIGTVSTTAQINYAATIIAHEVGHCIGFRHTDYMDRSYSCGGSVSNEGASTVGAILIPGTPSAADPNSWMLACIGSGQNRYFNANDVTALNYLY
ncbi:M57 family metalloprotease [Hymenobacter sp. DG25A]|uniref:M57 family metalloprotease n=1 Tax=Hymenobacter sp. DG25A TaxID=1385663 RepID=UPI0006BD586F|nr:M57 family metalloprotease [Hymenobacter sp. DG25A]ALD20171.1 protease [Hymenobacter sp. DG25A]